MGEFPLSTCTGNSGGTNPLKQKSQVDLFPRNFRFDKEIVIRDIRYRGCNALDKGVRDIRYRGCV